MKNRKGIVLAGGSATRLYPITLTISKQIMPVYDKPMIYYPISILMEMDIKDVLIISTPRDITSFKNLLQDGSKWGMKFEYKIQEEPRGLAEAFIIAEDFIGQDNVVMILGDNLFYGKNLIQLLKKANNRENEATIFGYYLKDPSPYGVVEIDKNGQAVSIEEKPKIPKSHYAIPGIYFYTYHACQIAKTLKPSKRGEIEITEIHEEYMKRGKLKVEKLDKEVVWFDTGTHDSLLEAANFVQEIEKKENKQICCPEEIAFRKKWINSEQLLNLAKTFMKTQYGKTLENIVKEGNY